MTTPDAPPAPTANGQVARRRAWDVRAWFRPLVVVPLLAVIALGAWAFASPIGSAPDDDFHLVSIWCANAARTDLCEPGPKADERVVPAGVLDASCYKGDPETSAVCQQPYFDEGSQPSVVTKRGNFENNYPPVYYAVMNLLAGPDVQVSALLMRLLNILLFVGLSTALYLLLPVTRRRVLIGMSLLTSVPLGSFLIASNNPSSWAIMGVGFSWLALLGFFETSGGRRITLGILTGVTAVMAAGARGDAALYVIVGLAVAVVLAFRRERRFLLGAILPVALAIVAGVFFLSSQQSGVATSGLGDHQLAAGAPKSAFALLALNLVQVPFLWTGVFGTWALGWLDTSMPAVVWVASLGVFAGVMFLAIGRVSRRQLLVLGGLGLLLWVLPAYVLVRGGNVVPQNVQPRYLLPLIVVVAGVALLPTARGPLRLSRAQGLLVFGGLAIAETMAMYTDIRRYVTGTDVVAVDLDSGREWWWSGLAATPMAVWAVGSLAFVALAAILVREMTKNHDRLT